MLKKLKVIFMGTPEFAVPTLDILYRYGYDIVGVITSVDKMGGRGRKTLLESAVKRYAVSKNLTILQPKNLKAPSFIESVRELKADIQVVVAFRMLPEVIWSMPPLGTINLHGSLLPKYRGAAPINWAIINGEKETGLSTFKLKHEIDTGNIIFQNKIPILNEDTAGSIHDKLMYMGPELMLRTIQSIEAGQVSFIEQDESTVTKAPKIFSDTCEIDFNQSSEKVINFIRGLSPYPGAWFTLGEKVIKVYKAKTDFVQNGLQKIGSIKSNLKNELGIYTSDGIVLLKEVQLTGKRRMSINDFLNGNKDLIKSLLEN